MGKFGFKELTLENWTQSDEILSVFVRLSPDGNTQAISGDDRIREILAPRLTDDVPVEVQGLFEVARGTLAYGYFFYPLYALGEEQLFRVAEAAVTYKCKAVGAPCSKWTFQRKINYLISHKAVPEKQRLSWEAVRKLRNISSHPDYQTIVPPGKVIGTLLLIADRINALFSTSD